jgi:hypothetical protein
LAQRVMTIALQKAHGVASMARFAASLIAWLVTTTRNTLSGGVINVVGVYYGFIEYQQTSFIMLDWWR